MKNEVSFIIGARSADIGIPVKRILPWQKKRMVGPFIFLDHMGPVILHPPEDRIDVRPHPHIGLSTLTYLFEGSMLHRDSLGYVQEILPGEVNWMTAGRGISHSERETEETRKKERTLQGLQFWVALPKHAEEIEPTFFHYGEDEIPKVQTSGATVTVVAGTYLEKKSPLIAHSPMLFLMARAHSEGMVNIPAQGFELALYVVKGEVMVSGKMIDESTMIVFKEGSDIEFSHGSGALVAVIGGETFPEPRYIWWNLVSSDREKIEAAKKAWGEGTFPQVPGEVEKMPLPPDSVPNG